MEENGSDGLDLYLYEVAMAFLEMTGRGCFLSPLELALVESWREREIPMAVLGRAFRKAGVGPGRPSSLVSLKRWVEREDRLRKRGKLAASAPLAEEDALRERLEAISEERFRELYRSFLAEPRSEEERGAFDEGIDARLFEFYAPCRWEEICREWSERYPNL
ncbi:MAG TPA: hypothetical protein PLB68_03630, partial [Candidatus Aminicenantes bacterium]|nr:hypothetical protein [Candidatus Aminicenantes bacterium]